MRNTISMIAALSAALSFAAVVPAAEAANAHGHGHGARGHYAHNAGRSHYAHNGYNRGYHRGRGHWHNGKWIALGVGAAILGAAAANSGCGYRC